MSEVWRLVTDGVLNVRDIDSVMTDGLGMRYAFLGPLQTTHLNADGFSSYCERYGKIIYDVSFQFGKKKMIKNFDIYLNSFELMRPYLFHRCVKHLVIFHSWADQKLLRFPSNWKKCVHLIKLPKNVNGVIIVYVILACLKRNSEMMITQLKLSR